MTSPAPLLSAAGAAIGSLLGSWRAAPTVVCRVEGAAVDTAILDILREQLQRCGPQNLTVPHCPHCLCEAEHTAGSLAVLLGVVFGLVLLSFVGGACLGSRLAAAQASTVRVEKPQPAETASQALVPVGTSAVSQTPRILTQRSERSPKRWQRR